MFVQRRIDRGPGLRMQASHRSSASATRLPESVSRSGRIATDQKAVQTRGPGRVVLGSKPQLATTEKLVSWATRATAKTRELGYQNSSSNSASFMARGFYLARLRRAG